MQLDTARVITNNNISGPAPNTGMPVCYAQPVKMGPNNKGGELLEPPSLTTHHKLNTWSPYGGVELEGVRKFTIYRLYQFSYNYAFL